MGEDASAGAGSDDERDGSPTNAAGDGGPSGDTAGGSSAGGSSAAGSSAAGSPSGEPSGDASSIASTVSSVLLGSIPRILGTLLLAVVLLGGLAFAAGAIGVPEVQGIENEFGGVNESTTVIDSEIQVHNPNPIGARFLGASGEYDITMNDVRMANGSTGAIDMDPGNSTIPLRTSLDNDRIPAWWASHVERGERTAVKINATVESGLLGESVPVEEEETIETDMLSSFNSTETRPINSSSPLVSDPVLYVNETTAQWGESNLNRTAIVIDFYVYNPKSYAIPISRLNYTIEMNDVRVGQGENTEEQLLAPKEVTQIRTVTYIDNQNLDDWWVTHVERDQVTDLVIDFGAAIEVSGTSITIPLDQMTHEETIRTDIFGTKNQSDDTNDSDDGSGGDDPGGDDGTTTTDDSTTTEENDTTTDDSGETTTEDDGPLPVVTVDRLCAIETSDRVLTLARTETTMERSTQSPDRVLLG